MDDIKPLEVGEREDHHEVEEIWSPSGYFLEKSERCRFHGVDS